MNVRGKTVRVAGCVALALAFAIGGCAIASDSSSSSANKLANPVANEQGDDPSVADGPSDLPSAEQEGPIRRGKIVTPAGELPIGYRLIGGEAVWEGDIKLPVDENGEILSAAHTGRRWPNAVVPYVIDANLPSTATATSMDRVLGAIAHWEANTKLRFVPRTNEANYIHFVAGSGCSANIGQQSFAPQFVNLNTSEGATNVRAVGINRTENITPQSQQKGRAYFFYSRGFATSGGTTRPNAASNHFRYIMPPGKGVNMIIDVAFANDGHMFTWYGDGTVSEGTPEDLGAYAAPKPFAVPAGKTAIDLVGIGIGLDDKVIAYFRDGTVATGTPTDLGSNNAVESYDLADGKTPTDLSDIDVDANGNVVAFYLERLPVNPDGGPQLVRGSMQVSVGSRNSLAMINNPVRFNFMGHCGTGETIHEIGHAIGLYHEQTRNDRDTYVKINFDNVTPDNVFNFEKHPRSVGVDNGPYDFGSVMHYGMKAFTSNGGDTIVPTEAARGLPGINVNADGSLTYEENRKGLSPGDIASVNIMYP